MKIWTSSYGIRKQPSLLRYLSPLADSELHDIHFFSSPQNDDVVIGWGAKPNTRKARNFAEKKGLPYLRLEDGFLAYAGHPAMGSTRLSLIVDRKGIYYDSRSASELEDQCNAIEYWFTQEFCQRSENLIDQITRFGLSKYNQPRCPLPGWVRNDSCQKILLVDQVRDDMSVECAQADATAFSDMLRDVRADYPQAQVLIKTHPDILLGKKKGYFDSATEDPMVRFLAEDCHLPELMNVVDRVFCVSSQLGFEALMYGKPVHCYGLPFYAGWGLTQDTLSCPRRTARLTLPQLVAAALIRYPQYRLPGQSGPCSAEDVLAHMLEKQQRTDAGGVQTCYAVGFSLWKRAFVKEFIGDMAREVRFCHSAKVARRLAAQSSDNAILVWGNNEGELESWARRYEVAFWRMEDGFVRSVGLGADLRRPSCLVIDTQGLYYRAEQPSDILTLLNNTRFTQAQRERGSKLQTMLSELAVTKYNLGYSDEVSGADHLNIRDQAAGREVILVPGQFEADQSIQNSRGAVKSNLALLQATRRAYPDAYILFKEHPDLYSGVRPGALGETAALKYADLYVTHVDMHELIQACDRVSTMTSLTGFEALIRHRRVRVWGSPFYAGWGLTDDELEFPERTANITAEELVYTALVLYCRCFSWVTRSEASPEQVIEELARERSEWTSGGNLSSSWLARQVRKARYLKEAFFR